MDHDHTNPDYPNTPDGRYFVVRGRLWRRSNPALELAERERLVRELMAARRAILKAKDDPEARRAARSGVDAAKRALGERGPPWWTDGAPDYNRHMVANTPYTNWFETVSAKDAGMASGELGHEALAAASDALVGDRGAPLDQDQSKDPQAGAGTGGRAKLRGQ
ncbi:hypothetical protein [Belnapia rosea]|uniref:hypothetical protein n=1 Tax=Belnapia rosea TaxID=938405 RepID=UPI000884C624|nr:hypothetical protein [Belnapia rosea]SDB05657.1 hypothetical protein SAMN02927895_00006 [Belnapia rosea]